MAIYQHKIHDNLIVSKISNNPASSRQVIPTITLCLQQHYFGPNGIIKEKGWMFDVAEEIFLTYFKKISPNYNQIWENLINET